MPTYVVWLEMKDGEYIFCQLVASLNVNIMP